MMKRDNDADKMKGILPYPIILSAVKADPDAMAIVVKHYQSYILMLSTKKYIDEKGNSYYGADEEIQERLRSKLIQSVLEFEM